MYWPLEINMIWTAEKHEMALNCLPENEASLAERAQGINRVFIIAVFATIVADVALIKFAINWLA